MTLEIKEANNSDLSKIAELKIGLAKYEKKFDKMRKIENKTSDIKWFKNIMKKYKGKIFVAFYGKEIVGYCTGWAEKRPYLVAKNGYICDLFVCKEYRKKKIATKLVKHLLNWFKYKNVKSIYLNVYSSNDAIKIWRNWGFKEIEIVMRK